MPCKIIAGSKLICIYESITEHFSKISVAVFCRALHPMLLETLLFLFHEVRVAPRACSLFQNSDLNLYLMELAHE